DLPSERLQALLKELQDNLKDVSYFGCYFDRSKAIGDVKHRSLCDEKGTFSCEGRWDKNFCFRSKAIGDVKHRSLCDEKGTFSCEGRWDKNFCLYVDLPSERLQALLKELQDNLKDVSYFGCYFDRSKAIGDVKHRSLCDEKGTFSCEGRWDKNFCFSIVLGYSNNAICISFNPNRSGYKYHTN
ncbi:DNA fragmentation factor 40 kDa, partial [Popillia japonica]